MTSTQTTLMLVAMIGLPIYLIIRFGGRGIFLGAVVQWGIGLMGALEHARRTPQEGMVFTAWLLGGWLVALVYCALVWGVLSLIHYLRQKSGKSTE